MCTVTFFPNTQSGYLISMNRDESRQRAAAYPPEKGSVNDVRFVRPIDGDEKGTWIGVNEYRLTLCLVNWFQAYPPDMGQRNYRTRGEIIPSMMNSKTLSDASKTINDRPLECYRPFRLLGFQYHPNKVMQWKWNGSRLKEIEEQPKANIWTSSGYDPQGVHRNRQTVFERFLSQYPHPTVEQVRHLHASTEPDKGIYSIAMWHERAYSVSNTIIEASDTGVNIFYIDGYPAAADKNQVTPIKKSLI